LNDIITLDDLREKFNCKSQKKVIEWLNKRGIKWDLDPNEQPFTTLSQVERHLEGKITEEAEF
jgi:hypothetical protein